MKYSAGFEILCVTMNQTDFSKIKEMNIRSDVLFANQADRVGCELFEFDGHRARMITTNGRGVGANRNVALMFADADICLLADDDIRYYDGLEETVLAEFAAHPDADVFIFNVDSDDELRKPIKYSKTRRHLFFERMPWGAVRMAFRLSSVRKANEWFTLLFGGGALFPSGEDSIWIYELKKHGLRIYLSDKTVGEVSYKRSTWFSGYDERFFFGKGAYCKAEHPKSARIRMIYYAWRYRRRGNLSHKEKKKWMKIGFKAYRDLSDFDSYFERSERCV